MERRNFLKSCGAAAMGLFAVPNLNAAPDPLQHFRGMESKGKYCWIRIKTTKSQNNQSVTIGVPTTAETDDVQKFLDAVCKHGDARFASVLEDINANRLIEGGFPKIFSI